MTSRSEDTRKKILDAARAEFSDKGLHGARVDVIAERSGANKERIYAYFGGKEQLFRETLKASIAEIINEEQFLLEQLAKDPTRMTEATLDHYISFLERHPHFWRLLAWENLSGGAEAEVMGGIREETFKEMRQLYKQRQKLGLFRKDISFEAFIYTLSAVSFFLFSNRHTLERTLQLDLGTPATRKKLMAEVLELINHGQIPHR
ncbi:MAG: HTH-type transcriptional repressor NicS [Verrucomicrobiae bacterium]|nr:HTH-type transcriptional repressor NicS [Verrucomicrobiae bacterium]